MIGIVTPLVIVHPKLQPAKSLSPRISVPDVLPADPKNEFPELREMPTAEPAQMPRNEGAAERLRRRMRAGMLSETTAGEMFLGQYRPDR